MLEGREPSSCQSWLECKAEAGQPRAASREEGGGGKPSPREEEAFLSGSFLVRNEIRTCIVVALEPRSVRGPLSSTDAESSVFWQSIALESSSRTSIHSQRPPRIFQRVDLSRS